MSGNMAINMGRPVSGTTFVQENTSNNKNCTEVNKPKKGESSSGGEKTEFKKEEQTKEQAEAAGQRKDAAIAEVAALKGAAAICNDGIKKDVATLATDTGHLEETIGKYDTREELMNAGFSKKTAKKVTRLVNRINGRFDNYNVNRIKGRSDNYNAVERIFTNKAEYEEAVKAAKADGTWDKDKPKYTLLKSDEVAGVKKMAAEAKKKVDDATAAYNKALDAYNNPKSDADKEAAMKQMVEAVALLEENYNASKMINENGEIDVASYKEVNCPPKSGHFTGSGYLFDRNLL